MTATIDTQADVERAQALVDEAAEQWRSAERDVENASGKYGALNNRMLELSEEVSVLQKKYAETSDAASLSITQTGYSAKGYGEVTRAKAELDAVSAAVQYIATVALPDLKKLSVAAALQERISAMAYHRNMSALEEAKLLHGAVLGGLAETGVMLDTTESKAARYQAASVEISREVERLQAELNSLK